MRAPWRRCQASSGVVRNAVVVGSSGRSVFATYTLRNRVTIQQYAGVDDPPLSRYLRDSEHALLSPSVQATPSRHLAFQRSPVPLRSVCLSVSGGRLRLRRRVADTRSLPRRMVRTQTECPGSTTPAKRFACGTRTFVPAGQRGPPAGSIPQDSSRPSSASRGQPASGSLGAAQFRLTNRGHPTRVADQGSASADQPAGSASAVGQPMHVSQRGSADIKSYPPL